MELQIEITNHKNMNRIQKEVPALIERVSRNNDKELLTKTWHDKDVVVPGPKEWIGSVKNVRILELINETFRGEVIDA